MNFARPCLLSACALLFAAPLAGAALANPADDTAVTPATAPAPQPGATATPEAAAEDAAEDKRICRYVKLDTASRRKTKLCRTTEEWRELNNPR